LQLRDAFELHVLIVNDAIHLPFQGKDQFFKAADVVACGWNGSTLGKRRHVTPCREARDPNTAVLTLGFATFLSRYHAADWVVTSSAIHHLLAQLFLEFLCLTAYVIELVEDGLKILGREFRHAQI
jgi:hypothetical protein